MEKYRLLFTVADLEFLAGAGGRRARLCKSYKAKTKGYKSKFLDFFSKFWVDFFQNVRKNPHNKTFIFDVICGKCEKIV